MGLKDKKQASEQQFSMGAHVLWFALQGFIKAKEEND